MLIDQWTRIGHNIELDCLETSCLFIAESLDKAVADLEKNYSQKLSQVDQEHRDAFEGFLQDEHWNLTRQYPRFQWHSHYLLSYGLFETILNSYCDIAAQKLSSNLKLKDLSGQGIERAKNYLSKVAKLESCFNTPEWQSIKLAGEIRNIIAHTAGHLNYDNNSHKKLAEKLRHVKDVELVNETDNGSDILVSQKFVVSTIRNLRTFINRVGTSEVNS
ncbi:hypothetical protein [Vibrio fluvialis]|uniref:hypothetical protein n=1 Tax=Vibrio fluvialis TaxID=676 RepID=UPI001404FD80|nr:hypothetical protein [Vibrio fluvialis]EKO3980242.1 hypothetical protein [Vibrio fluvialis]MBY8242790.1 hypothetical protein [Vibrio fluvialis]NHN71680.1 hypothetical protein [Vibrio fluvialis]